MTNLEKLYKRCVEKGMTYGNIIVGPDYTTIVYYRKGWDKIRGLTEELAQELLNNEYLADSPDVEVLGPRSPKLPEEF